MNFKAFTAAAYWASTGTMSLHCQNNPSEPLWSLIAVIKMDYNLFTGGKCRSSFSLSMNIYLLRGDNNFKNVKSNSAVRIL